MKADRPLGIAGLINGLLTQLPAREDVASPRRKGRPKIRTQSHYEAIWREYEAMQTWFLLEFGRAQKSDRELITQYVAAQYEANGLRVSRAWSDEAQSRIKTMRNELGVARRCLQSVPKNGLLVGCPGNDSEGQKGTLYVQPNYLR
ncbi:hypothetical protein PSQ20_21770 [Curvibacter sp. RS43]|uniref:hypothetical protein n=1 Tax=Curvibacter microcysteis TaxID=3026419 RepID=UPI002361AA43|nr:hypothetical protein [Curvibacter sp. RS43]MDD0812979.1 hypothetical protein [Curvibacter sp. RS43]